MAAEIYLVRVKRPVSDEHKVTFLQIKQDT